MRANGNVVGSKERVLIEGWCQQYTSHSIGMIGFGPDGALYATGGDGASFVFADYGQGGDPANPCGDPGGSSPTPPTAEGGALRSQDLRTAGDPTGLGGTFIRVDAMTGAALPDNPLYGGAVADDDRIVASGMRNPFRFAARPGTDQIFIGDVGWTLWEEIDRLNDVNDGVVENFGWPCYEGSRKQPDYDATNLDICEALYGEPGAVTAPLFAYHHERQVVTGENCPVGSSVISAITFYAGGAYPDEYDGALFFGDHSRNCLWVMFPGLNGEPDPATRATFLDGASYPVDLKIGPDGDLFYVDYDEGQVRRISYTG
jgi:glucose/arabinose dehydrogenase